ncbi:unnamed protein product [Orchesella dallaii]|uniref:Disease resistance R13L4/SHOC-2-like LRR domain-containing protein n=1 Tax=Orchesella dallaii TaxID=48710 RepID=A0ABP1RM68_9HEXA
MKKRSVPKHKSADSNGTNSNNGNEIEGRTFGKIPSKSKVTAQASPVRAGKPSNVRAFVQANRNQNRIINSVSLFQNETKTDELSPALIKNARKSGVLNISSRNLMNVPPKVWIINELDENEKSNVSVALDAPSPDKWWEFADLNKLIIANNYISEIPDDIVNLVSLQFFDAHDNQITKVSEKFGELKNLQKVNLSHNRMLELPESFFDLKRLTELKLSHNKLSVISSEIGLLSCLRILDLSHNSLTAIPGDLGFLTFLNTLNLANNQIKELPQDIGGLTGLRSLDVSENYLTCCPKSFREFLHLEVLYMQRNKITELPDLGGCKALKEIYMQNNALVEFSSETFAVTRVQLLDFRANKIETLLITKEDLEFVDRFYLDNNEIAVIPNELALLPSLKALTLDGNPLRGIRLDILQRGTLELLKYLRGKLNPSDSFNDSGCGNDTTDGKQNGCRKSLRGCSTADELEIDRDRVKASRDLNLVARQMSEVDNSVMELASDAKTSVIDMSKNILTSLPESMEMLCEFLTELKIDFNRLTSLPPCLGRCRRLQYLSFQNNQIASLPDEFADLNKLREINFGYNKFTSIPECLYTLRCLEIIIAISNKIDTINLEGLNKLPMLAVLDLSNNNIAQVPPELGLLTQLKSLNLEGNAFRVPSYHVLSQGTDAVLRFLQNRIPK